MADYYSLLARAVAAMPNSTAEQRRAVYERARAALLGQLRAIDPPISEIDVARENSSLDGAVAQIELEIAAKAAEGEKLTEKLTKEPFPKPPTFKTPTFKTTIIKEPPAKEPPAKERHKEPPAADPALADLPKLRPSLPFPGDGASEENFESFLEETDAQEDEGEATSPDRHAQRPEAPQRAQPRVDSRRNWILGGAAACVVLAIALTAFALRGRPVETAPMKSEVASAEDQPAQGKISGRATGADNGRGPMSAGNPPFAQTRAGAGEPVPLAHKAYLFVAAPEASEQVKSFTGSVVWRFENVPTGPGQPLGAQIHADVDVPEAGLRLTLDIKRVEEATLAFSHTIELQFILTPGGETPGVKDVGVIQMRREESRRGEPLAGMVAQIVANSRYLVGLQRGDQEKRNIDMLRERAWIDVPFLMSDGRAAKLSLEKGLTGDRVFNDALAAWAAEK